jgi:hypothetical protein
MFKFRKKTPLIFVRKKFRKGNCMAVGGMECSDYSVFVCIKQIDVDGGPKRREKIE